MWTSIGDHLFTAELLDNPNACRGHIVDAASIVFADDEVEVRFVSASAKCGDFTSDGTVDLQDAADA